ncbi:SDR family oxidoreductase [Actinomadura sp. 7K534]|uniref:SDR family oxidoreductase n=1 Tax=Actinomadura sp. 7K534 TaxID=2530366 RepID=UPI0010499C70|nr:SDR family oxidoreductase [Actinomadura sp. 7K534]TDB93626.1 NAD(P)-dependent oxidoreductase [Actinomadura sp. 7K534]
MSDRRVFITCGAGFVVSHVLKPLLDSDPSTQLTLLLLADSQAEADNYLKNLLFSADIPRRDHHRVCAIYGDLRKHHLGINDLHLINSNYWLNGTLPFKFGHIRQQSVDAADQTISNYLGLLNAYNATIERVEHYLQLSSIRVSGQSPERLPESLVYDHETYGNFDYCKHRVEIRLKAWLGSHAPSIKFSLVRIGSLLSPRVSRIGGGVLLLTKELLGFGRCAGGPRWLVGDSDAVLRISSAEYVGKALADLLTSPPGEISRIVNLCDGSNRLTVRDYLAIISRLRAECNADMEPTSISLVSTRSDIKGREATYCEWLDDKFGWLLARRCTIMPPQTSNAETLLGSPLMIGHPEASGSSTLLDETLSAATKKHFIPTAPNVGAAPIY